VILTILNILQEGSTFYHPFFVRGEMEKCGHIVREKKRKENATDIVNAVTRDYDATPFAMREQQTLSCTFDSVVSSSRPIETQLKKPRPVSDAGSLLVCEGRASLSDSPDLMDLLVFGGAEQPTISWLFSGAVSLSELSTVLNSYSGLEDEAPRCHDGNSDACAIYKDDIISLFGESSEDHFLSFP
jgi:hypothetical protein